MQDIDTRCTREQVFDDDIPKANLWRVTSTVPLTDKWQNIRKVVVTTHWTYRLCEEAGGWYFPEGVLVTKAVCFDAGDAAGRLLYHWWTRPTNASRLTKKAIIQQHEKTLANEMEILITRAEKLPIL